MNVTTTLPAGTAVAREMPLAAGGAGARSYDRTVLEEQDRMVADRFAGLCCTVTPSTAAELSRRGNVGSSVVPTAKTVDEALLRRVLPVLRPLRPGTAARRDGLGSHALLDGMRVLEPVTYGDLALGGACAVLVTHSDAVQQEATVAKRPVRVMRPSTGRPDVLGAFARQVRPGSWSGDHTDGRLSCCSGVHERRTATPRPYGGRSAWRRILDVTASVVAG